MLHYMWLYYIYEHLWFYSINTIEPQLSCPGFHLKYTLN